MDLYSPAELIALVDFTEPQPYYWLERAFNENVFAKGEEIVFDDIIEDVRIAPFVVPVNNGKPIVHQGYNSRTFKPAYIKLADPIRPEQLSKRPPGAPINAPVDRVAQLRAARVNRLGQHRASILKRLEWMAWQYMLYGKYTVSGEGYPTVLVDFGRDVNNTVTLAGLDLWSAPSSATPLTDFEDWSNQILKTAGVAGRLVTMSVEAYQAAKATTQWKEEYTNFKSNGGSIPDTSPKLASRVQYIGKYGQFDIEIVNTTYKDEAGTEQRYMPAGKVIMSAPGPDALGGMKAFGRIQHMKAVELGDPMVDVFAYEFPSVDGSAINMGAESAPLLVGKRVNAALTATVI